EERGELAVAWAAHRRTQAAEHEHDPEDEADGETELPEAPEVEILGALMAEPEPEAAERVVDAEVLAEQAAENHDRERAEEHQGAQALTAWLVAADQRREEQATRDPGGGDPEDRQLQVPRAQEVVREPSRQVETVEPARLDAVVRQRPA